jgi:phenylacetate-CoA ligase
MGELYRTVTKLILPRIYDLSRNTKRVQYQKILEKTQWYTPDYIRENQLKKIKTLLIHCNETVPYYHKLFKEKGIDPTHFKSLRDLENIPCLTKIDIQNNQQELISTTVPRQELYHYHSGGTNYPINFLLTKEHNSWEIAAEFRAYNWMGYKFGDPCIYLGGTLNPEKKPSILRRLTNFFENKNSIKFHKVTDQSLKSLVERIRKLRPEVIRANASSVYFIGQFIQRYDINDIKPRVVITAAENLLSEQKKIVEDAFQCPVYDYYGSREFGSLASECSLRSGYHITAENVVLEFVREGEHVASGEMGNVFVTNLRNFGMPFLRYDIGDVASPSDMVCPCGRGLPLMDEIGGRANDFLAYYDPEMEIVIPLSNPVVVAGMLYKLPIQNFLIKQEKISQIDIDLVPLKEYSNTHSRILLEHLEKQLGDYLDFTINIVEEIPALPSGKRSIVKSNVSPFKR